MILFGHNLEFYTHRIETLSIDKAYLTFPNISGATDTLETKGKSGKTKTYGMPFNCPSLLEKGNSCPCHVLASIHKPLPTFLGVLEGRHSAS